MAGLNLADYIGLAVVLLLALWGVQKGLVRSVFSLGSFILSLILALTLYPVVSDFLADSVIGDYVRVNVFQVFEKKQADADAAMNPDKVLNLPGSFSETINGAADRAIDAITDSVSESVASVAIKLLGILVVFLLVRLILWILLTLLDTLSKLPVIHSANKILGGVLGVCSGILAVYLILALLTFATTLKTFNKPIEIVLQSKYVSEMYHQNILLTFLK